MTSLFVLALPRTLSTLTFHVARLSLNLEEPLWTSDGEILNTDRYIHYAGARQNEGLKFIRAENNADIFRRIVAFLDHIVVPNGFIYKDVVHPFVMAHWLRHKNFKVLKIKRVLADVVYSMLEKKWHYPAMAVNQRDNMTDAIIQGLLLAEKSLDSVAGETIDYDFMVQDELVIQQALKCLYPDAVVHSMGYIEEEFHGQLQAVLKRRQTDVYLRIQERITLFSECLITGEAK